MPLETKRLRFFRYFFTAAADWLAEQLYHRGRMQRHNQYVHGSGIAAGLRLQPTNPPSLQVRVPPGLAIDPNGEELWVDVEQVVDLSPLVPSAGTRTVYVALEHTEQETDPVFVEQLQRQENTRVTERTVIVVLTVPPGSPRIEIGRVTLGAGATGIRAAADPANPQVNEIDWRQTRSLQGAGMDERIREWIVGHRHDGSAGNPRRVILESETSGTLSGSRIVGTVPDADTVDHIHASTTPKAEHLYPLGSDAKFPLNVLPQGPGSGNDADTTDGRHAGTPGGTEPTRLAVTDSQGRVGRAAQADNADTVDGLHASSTPQEGRLYPLGPGARYPTTVLPQGHGSGNNADTVDNYHASKPGGTEATAVAVTDSQGRVGAAKVAYKIRALTADPPNPEIGEIWLRVDL